MVKKGLFDECVFGDFSKTSQPIGIILVPKVDVFDHFPGPQPFFGKEFFLKKVGSKGPNFREPSERQKFLEDHLFIQLERLTVSADLVLSQVDRLWRLYCGNITFFLDFWRTLRGNLPESAKLLSNPP